METVDRRLTTARPGAEARTTTVVIADADPLVISGLALLIGSCPTMEVIGSCLSGTEAVFQTRCHQPNVVVMDIGLFDLKEFGAALPPGPGRSGSSPRVLLISSIDDAATVVHALQSGASGFLLRRSAPADLVRAILHVAAGRAWLDPHVTAPLIEIVARTPLAGHGRGAAAVDRLTPRELEVLLLMADGLSNCEISERLVVTEGTVKTHVSRVLMKLAARDRAQAIALAYRSGWVSMAC